jgi:hypothetical protein
VSSLIDNQPLIPQGRCEIRRMTNSKRDQTARLTNPRERKQKDEYLRNVRVMQVIDEVGRQDCHPGRYEECAVCQHVYAGVFYLLMHIKVLLNLIMSIHTESIRLIYEDATPPKNKQKRGTGHFEKRVQKRRSKK